MEAYSLVYRTDSQLRTPPSYAHLSSEKLKWWTIQSYNYQRYFFVPVEKKNRLAAIKAGLLRQTWRHYISKECRTRDVDCFSLRVSTRLSRNGNSMDCYGFQPGCLATAILWTVTGFNQAVSEWLFYGLLRVSIGLSRRGNSMDCYGFQPGSLGMAILWIVTVFNQAVSELQFCGECRAELKAAHVPVLLPRAYSLATM